MIYEFNVRALRARKIKFEPSIFDQFIFSKNSSRAEPSQAEQQIFRADFEHFRAFSSSQIFFLIINQEFL